MEYGLTTDVFLKPSHPYTIGLLETMPRIDKEYEILKTIPAGLEHSDIINKLKLIIEEETNKII